MWMRATISRGREVPSEWKQRTKNRELLLRRHGVWNKVTQTTKGPSNHDQNHDNDDWPDNRPGVPLSNAFSQYLWQPPEMTQIPARVASPLRPCRRAQRGRAEGGGSRDGHGPLERGSYYLPETLVFTAEDSGTKAAPVVYQAYRKEQAVISGGVRLKNLKWEPYKDGIMQAKVPAGFATDQLFVERRAPTHGAVSELRPQGAPLQRLGEGCLQPGTGGTLEDPAGGFIHALHAAEWGGMHYVITGKGPDNKITYEGGWQNNRPMGMNDIRFVENIFEELDAPGEWFLDQKTSTLYFYPPAGVDLAKATIEAVRLRHLIEFRGTEHSPVRFVSFKD